MAELTKQGVNLLRLLDSCLDKAIPKNPRTFISYKQVHEKLGLPQQGPYGESLKRQGLVSLADWTAAENLPAITGLIVSEDKLEPGQGYFSLFGKTQTDYKWWESEIARAKDFNWKPFIIESSFLPKLPVPPDAAKPPEKTESKTYRYLRDTNMTRRVKSLHNYRCQICETTITLLDGTFYAEAHHIMPLGGSHAGPDMSTNILCLCPNHHVELDYGIRRIDIADLKCVPGHRIDQKFIDYHNDNIYKYKNKS